ncbi:MAG: hypothetical protein LBK42_08210 [Propionibacteriaceae bacterium]|jgi:hypothetical protein|nr:hypothetical protein [Propionibacteriaceae bacterium]
MPVAVPDPAVEADRLRSDLGIDPARPVDPFAAIVQLGLVLVFQPLDNLLGAVLPGSPGGAAGVLLSRSRHVTVQRLTAAHEIGHWKLHFNHNGPVARLTDDAAAVIGESGQSEQFDHADQSDQPNGPVAPGDNGHKEFIIERQARRFARAFLLPPELLRRLAERHWPGGRLTPEAAYLMARDAGAPYSALLRLLRDRGEITPSDYDRLEGVHPRAIKERLAGRPAPSDSEVWVVGARADDDPLNLVVDDQFWAGLDEQAGTGYRWLEPSGLTRRPPRPAPPSFAAPGAKVVWSEPVAAAPPDAASKSEPLPDTPVAAGRPGSAAEAESVRPKPVSAAWSDDTASRLWGAGTDETSPRPTSSEMADGSPLLDDGSPVLADGAPGLTNGAPVLADGTWPDGARPVPPPPAGDGLTPRPLSSPPAPVLALVEDEGGLPALGATGWAGDDPPRTSGGGEGDQPQTSDGGEDDQPALAAPGPPESDQGMVVDFEPAPLLGGVVGRRLRFDTTNPGRRDIELVYARPWDPDSAIRRVQIPATVWPTPARQEHDQQLRWGAARLKEQSS